METTQMPASPPSSPLSIPVTGLTLTSAVLDPGFRFQGDGVRYKAKLIGIDHVTSAEGEKMCWDSMMKLKGFEVAFRKQGRHKQRVWLKICSSGVRIVDEKSGAEMYVQEKMALSAVTRDESDPRALAYIYRHMDNYYLFYLRMANLAEPVVNDIREVCQASDPEPVQETPPDNPQKVENDLQSSAVLVVPEAPPAPSEEAALENVFSPRPDSSSEFTQGSTSELMQVFSPQMKDPIEPDMCPPAFTDPEPVLEPPKPALSKTQILSMFVPQPGSVVYPPSPWAQQGMLGNQWAGAPFLAQPGSAPVWPTAAPPTGQVMNNANGPHTENAAPATNAQLDLLM